MALTPDLNDDQLDIFRSKVCQRLSRDGLCQWKSKCQFSHCIEWPRRPPRKHRYSPAICPNLRMVSVSKDGGFAVTNKCEAGRLCRFAHSSEEVLYHPLIYKTTICEEFTKQNVQRNVRTAAASKKRCQQYYCPFAHGEDELRTSSLHADHIKMYLSSLQAFTAGEPGKMQEQANTTKDVSCNPQEGNVMGSIRPAAPEVEETYADLKQDLLLFPPILSTAPGLHPWVDQWTSPQLAGPQTSKINAKDDILAIKPKSCLVSPPVLPAPQCKEFLEFPQGKIDDVWALNLPLPMKVPFECNDGKGIQKAAVEDDEDDSDQIFRDLSAYMYDML